MFDTRKTVTPESSESITSKDQLVDTTLDEGDLSYSQNRKIEEGDEAAKDMAGYVREREGEQVQTSTQSVVEQPAPDSALETTTTETVIGRDLNEQTSAAIEHIENYQGTGGADPELKQKLWNTAVNTQVFSRQSDFKIDTESVFDPIAADTVEEEGDSLTQGSPEANEETGVISEKYSERLTETSADTQTLTQENTSSLSQQTDQNIAEAASETNSLAQSHTEERVQREALTTAEANLEGQEIAIPASETLSQADATDHKIQEGITASEKTGLEIPTDVSLTASQSTSETQKSELDISEPESLTVPEAHTTAEQSAYKERQEQAVDEMQRLSQQNVQENAINESVAAPESSAEASRELKKAEHSVSGGQTAQEDIPDFRQAIPTDIVQEDKKPQTTDSAALSVAGTSLGTSEEQKQQYGTEAQSSIQRVSTVGEESATVVQSPEKEVSATERLENEVAALREELKNLTRAGVTATTLENTSSQYEQSEFTPSEENRIAALQQYGDKTREESNSFQAQTLERLGLHNFASEQLASFNQDTSTEESFRV